MWRVSNTSTLRWGKKKIPSLFRVREREKKIAKRCSGRAVQLKWTIKDKSDGS